MTVSSKGLKPAFWTNGGLQCNLYGADTPYLVAPNFKVTPPAVIDVRTDINVTAPLAVS